MPAHKKRNETIEAYRKRCNEYMREYRDKNRKKLRDYNRKYNQEWRIKNGYHNENKWKMSNKRKLKAEYYAQYAIHKGLIPKLPCEVCNNPKAGGHHNNYKEAHKLIFLCHKHHKWTHSIFGEKDLQKISKEKLLNFLKEYDKMRE